MREGRAGRGAAHGQLGAQLRGLRQGPCRSAHAGLHPPAPCHALQFSGSGARPSPRVLAEELQALQALYARLDRCPLGAAAGFGVPLPIDREYTAQLLGFSGVQVSPVDVQNSRGRHELALLNAFASIGLTMEKFLWDVSLYSMQEFGFLKLPDAFTTGSSIMPQKAQTRDVVELASGAACREPARLRRHGAGAGLRPAVQLSPGSAVVEEAAVRRGRLRAVLAGRAHRPGAGAASGCR